MNPDPITWFLGKHYVIAALMLPEAAFAFAVWQRWYLWAAVPFSIWLLRPFFLDEVKYRVSYRRQPMGGTDDEVQVGSGKTPEGVAVSYWEIDRPGTVGAKGSQGFLIEVRDENGKRLTHSDSLAGLKKAGFTVDDPRVPKPEPTPAPREKALEIEDELAA